MSTTPTRRDVGRLGLGLGAAALAGRTALAQAPAFFRIGTGGTAGTYYPVGGLIANAISNPPQLVLTAQASNGSVANVNAIASGALESGFTQADVAYWAYSGTGLFEGKGGMADLRLLANLYPESIHLVAAKAANIKSVADLKGKRVSLDEPGSGTLVDSRIILDGFGLKESDVKADFLKPNQAAEKMRDGGMDAFFFVGGYPTSAITELAATGGGIDHRPDRRRRPPRRSASSTRSSPPTRSRPTPTRASAPSGPSRSARNGSPPPRCRMRSCTRSSRACGATRPGPPSTPATPRAGSIRKETALQGAGIPVHPGAERFYQEAGLSKA